SPADHPRIAVGGFPSRFAAVEQQDPLAAHLQMERRRDADNPRADNDNLMPLRHAPSSQFKRREADKPQNASDDPEADDDRRFRPAELFEMVMDRRHAENALAGKF